MKRPAVPFSLPETIEPALTRVLAYWQRLKRAENEMPFWDDVTTSALPDLADRLMLIRVFAKPERFRLGSVGRQLLDRCGEPVAGHFIDEIELPNPFEYLRAQCSATVESRAPTYYQHCPGGPEQSRRVDSYSRLLVPLWGNGHIGMVLGAVDWPA
jgi:hypothetical protein